MSILHEASVNLSKRTPIFGLQLWVVIVIILGVLSVFCLVLLCFCVTCHRKRDNHHRQQRQTKQIPDVPPVSKKNQEIVHHPAPAPEIQVDIEKIDRRVVFSDRPLSGESRGTGSLRETPSFGSELVGPEVSHLGWGRWFTLRELEAATDGLCEEHVIGEGSYGIVYWGILSDGTKVAIKNLLNNRGQAEKEFKDEVEAIGRIRHKNLVRLLGYCVEGAYRMLVYEYVDNGNVDEWLYGDVGDVSPLTWEIRMKIILGTAKGLAYLHEGLEPKVVHRDVKSSNILLDRQWNARISDFGLAKLLCSDRSQVTTRVMGTCGYVAPEYLCTGMLTEKSDVYSFGILIMEIITGRTPVDYSRPEGEVKLVDWLKTMVGNRKSEAVLDPKLPDMPSSKALKRVLLVALRCVDPEARKRPKIGHVLHMLDPDDLLPFDHRIPREPSNSSGEENRGVAIHERSSDTSEGDSCTNNHHHPTRWR